MNREVTIYNVDLTVADQDYNQPIPDGTVKVLVRSRNGSEIQLWYDDSDEVYITIPAGSGGKYIEGCELFDKTLYMNSPDGSDVAEIEVWK